MSGSSRARSQARGLAALATGVVLTMGLAACGGGDDAGGAGGVGAAAAGGDGATSTSEGGSTATATATEDATTTSTEGLSELPPPDIPASASPPTTAPGTEPIEIPEGPLIGEFVVDVEPLGFVDVPVELRQGQHVSILSNADDGIITHISIYAPDSTVLGEWDGGEPGVINGWTFDDKDKLPTTGVYVIRVQHRRGGDDPFMLRFYGEA